MRALVKASQRSSTRTTVKPRRIVVSANSCWNIANFRSELIRKLVADGHSVTVLAPADDYAGAVEALGAALVPIAIDSAGLSPLADLRLLLTYIAELHKARADAFLGFTVKPNVYGSLGARLLGVPAINNVSGLGTAFLGGGALRRLVSALYRLALGRSATVFFQNADDEALFIEQRLVRPEQARLLAGSGIDLARFAPAELPAGKGFTFLLVARLLWDKGIGEYVEAARAVATRHPHARFQLLGQLGAANRTAVPGETVQSWVEEGVVDYLGTTDDVRSVMAAADCIVLPSYREGLPRSIIEAAAIGRPAIATDVPGCRQAVDDGVTGYLCEPRSAASLADAMERMIALSAGSRAKMGRAARQKAEREFDHRLILGAYDEALERAAR